MRPEIGREHEHDDDTNDEDIETDTEAIMKTKRKTDEQAPFCLRDATGSVAGF